MFFYKSLTSEIFLVDQYIKLGFFWKSWTASRNQTNLIMPSIASPAYNLYALLPPGYENSGI